MKHTNVSKLARIWICHVTMSVLLLVFAVLACIGIARVILPGQTWQADMMALVWPESSPQEKLQFALGGLRRCADTYTADEQGELQERCRVLENQGLAVAVYQDGQIVYATDGSDPWQTVAAAQKKIAGQQTGTDTVNPDTDTAAMIWKENTLAYLYMSRSTGVQVAAVSQEAIAMPRAYKGMYPLHMQQTWVWLSIVWLCISCFLVWIVLSKRIIKKMIPYVPLRLDMQQQKRHGPGHRQDRNHPDASAHNRQ